MNQELILLHNEAIEYDKEIVVNTSRERFHLPFLLPVDWQIRGVWMKKRQAIQPTRIHIIWIRYWEEKEIGWIIP